MSTRTYSDAITALNSLQSNFAILSAIRASGKKMNEQAIPEMIEWVRRIGYKPSDFDPLNIIHVAGTKGKGSTCAFAASILNQYRCAGVLKKIGLYTSPHLRAVRERIQLDGKPLSEEAFAKYFFEVWDRMEESAAGEGLDPKEKPVYFRFLTLVAFHTYISEGVDTAVFEVGVGGEYDSTNIIEKPTVTGITSLGIDHTGVLGETIEEITWHKAGIMKASAPCLTVEQPREVMEVIFDRAREKSVPVTVATVHPDIESGKVRLGLPADFQKGNATLAVRLVGAHLKRLGLELEGWSTESLPEPVRKGLEKVDWPGRCQVVSEGSLEWSIDGAHTKESLGAAGKWFASRVGGKAAKRVLIFNQQNRDAPEKLVGALADVLKQKLGNRVFDHAVFSTNVTYKNQSYKPDLMSVGSDSAAVAALTVQKNLARAWKEVDPSAETHIMATIEEAVGFARSLGGDVQVLVTGSLHLVGGLLEVIDSHST